MSQAKEHAQKILNVAQYHYPEVVHKIFFINAPFIFRAVWAAVSPLVHPVTKEKIKILGGTRSA